MKTATETNLKIGSLTVEFDDEAGDGYDWHLMTGHGTCWESFATRAEAIREAKRVERQDRAEALRDDISGLLDDCQDPEVLAKIKALLLP